MFPLEKAIRNDAIRQVYNDLVRVLTQTEETLPGGIIGHSERVSLLSVAVGKKMGMKSLELYQLRLASALHDVGKIEVNRQILTKQKLSPSEFEEIKKHSEYGYRMLNSASSLREVALYVLHHHERYDGTGYPAGLKEDSIPLHSQIIAVCEAYDIMTNVHCWAKTMTSEKAVNELNSCVGTQFSPVVVAAFIKALPLFSFVDVDL